MFFYAALPENLYIRFQFMNISLKNKRALVCGSTIGIGKAVAIELASLGAEVTLLARNELRLSETLKELPRNNDQQHAILLADHSDPVQFADVVNFYLRSVTVNILVNNTGGPPAGPVSYAKTDEFTKAFNAHLICNHILATACIDGMRKSGYGRIINIISTSVKQPISGLGVSNTIRAAVANWAKTLAGELGQYGITVNNVLPGATATQRLSEIVENKSKSSGRKVEEIRAEMLHEIPMARFGTPEEIAAGVAFLASPAAAYINGINLPVDGGRTACL